MTQNAAQKTITGIHAATLCPLDEERRLRLSDLESHVASVTAARGIKGLLLNGHAGEGHFLSMEERRRVVETVRRSVPDNMYLTVGVTSEGTEAAMAEAEQAAASGADAVLVFPPNGWALGHDPEMVFGHHEMIAAACGLPVILYRAPVGAGRMSYTLETLARLMDLRSVVGIKEGSWEVAAYEEVKRLIEGRRNDVAVLSSGDEHLMTSYLIGTVGSQVSLAAIVPDLVVGLFEAAGKSDWNRARNLHDKLYPLATEIYRRQPGYMATARLKACLHMLGHIGSASVKRPMREADAKDRQRLEAALAQALG